jgi:hypothetical protein
MKGHKAHHDLHGMVKHQSMKHVKHRKAGGRAESPEHGVDEAMEDLHRKNIRYTGGNPEDEAEAMHAKHGGRAKRKHGGHVVHHHMGHVKHVGAVHGEHAMHHAGRKPRKAGGGVEANPFSSALKGTPGKGRKVEKESMGENI